MAFVWVNAIEHGRKLISDFGVSDMFPSLLAIAPLKSQYRVLRNAFDEKTLSSFLDSFNSGLKRTPYTNRVLLDKPKKAKVEEHPEL